MKKVMVSYETKKLANAAYVVCKDCGEKYGNRPEGNEGSTWWSGKCDVCKRKKGVTDFKGFSYSKYQWGYPESIVEVRHEPKT